MGQPACYRVLVKNLSNLTSSYRAATLTDSETELLVKSYRSDELNVDLDIVTRHNHFNALRESNLASNVKSSDEELRTIVIVEWSMTATLFLLQHINLSLEVFRCQDRTATANFKKEDSKKAKKTLTIRYCSDKIAPVAEK